MKTYQKISFLLAFAVAIFIFYISSKEFPPNPLPTLKLVPVIYHFSVFLMFAFFLFISAWENNRYFSHEFLVIFLLAVVYAALDEFHQAFVPGRSAAIGDFFIDSSGILVSFILVSAGTFLKR